MIITLILFIMIGLKLNMSTIYYILLGIGFFIDMVALILRAYKLGKKLNKDEI